jgi:lipopolysaccharide export LptBFGC system permease protein LptF
MLSRRYIVLVAFGGALAFVYRVALRDHLDDPSGWPFFVAVWLPFAVLLGLAVTYGWPALLRRWNRWRNRR